MSSLATPPRSPPSSPSLYIDSSSPASSPVGSFEHPDEDAIPPISLVHPFAGSGKAHWHPPEYEKKSSSSPTTTRILKKARCEHITMATRHSSPRDNIFPNLITGGAQVKEWTEEDIWDTASTRMVDEGHGAITLDNENLRLIPESFIDDLAKFYAPPENHETFSSNARLSNTYANRSLNRVATVPAVNAERSMQRTHSTAAVSFGLPRDKIQLFLSSNQISVLPLSLFSLQNLTVLSLRKNKIAYIPPEIAGLKCLEDLNISQNLIQYLPAEMLQLSLKSLHVHPNPFRSIVSPDYYHNPPSSSSQANAFVDLRRRPVSDTSYTTPSSIPPLVELLLRVLLLPSHPTQLSETILEACYETPLPEGPRSLSDPSTGKIHFQYSLPIHLRKTLNVCLPGSVYLEDETANEHLLSPGKEVVTGIGSCPSPKHQQSKTPRLFVRHAEERMTWEKMVAGVDVGGSVPLLWRGCQRGCLDFLEPPIEEPLTAVNVPNAETESMDVEHENADVVQPIQLGTLGTSDLDFDD